MAFTAEEDYGMLSATNLHFNRSQTTDSVRVAIFRDNLREDDEAIEVQILDTILVQMLAGVPTPTLPSPADRITIAPGTAQIIIQDINGKITL